MKHHRAVNVRESLSYPAGTIREFAEIYSNSECNPIGNYHKFNPWEEEEKTKAGGYEDTLTAHVRTKTFKIYHLIYKEYL